MISHLVGDKRTRELAGEEAQKQVHKNFDIKDTVKKYIKILEVERV